LKPRTILTRLPSHRMADAELTHIERLPIDIALADRQHEAYRNALAATGVRVIALPALDDHPDGAFVEDVLLSLPETSVLCRPGSASRRGEVLPIEGVLPADRPSVRISGPGTLDGGDVLRVGKQIFVGRSMRTNAAGIMQLANIVRGYEYEVTMVEVRGALHLKTAVTSLAPDLLLFNPDWIDVRVFDNWHRIAVAPGEDFAANSLEVGNHIFMAAAYPATAERVAAAGLAVTSIDISEFAKAEAGLTCLSVVVPERP
jgi:dimethylargininase